MKSTLLLLFKDNQILLAKKKKGFGEGLYNGVGGKLEPGETEQQAMIRECEEEINVTPTVYEKVAENNFIEYYKGQKTKLTFYLYIATEWQGTIKESPEMKPYWFNIQDIPYNQMFPDDKYWLPLVLENKKFIGNFEFNEQWELLDYHIEEVDNFNI